MTRVLLPCCFALSFFNLGVACFAHVSPRLYSRIDLRELRRLEPLIALPTLLAALAALAAIWTHKPGLPPTPLLASASLQIGIWALTTAWWQGYARRLHANTWRLVMCVAHAALMLFVV